MNNILTSTVKALESSGIRLANMIELADAEYRQYFDLESHEYVETARWTFSTASGTKVTVDTYKGVVEAYIDGKYRSLEIGDQLLQHLRDLASLMFLHTPERKPTLNERLRGYDKFGGRLDDAIDSEDDLRKEQDAQYESDTQVYDYDLDWQSVMRKGVDPEWEAGHSDFTTRFVRDVMAKPKLSPRTDAPMYRASFEYTDECRAFVELQEELKRIPAKEAWRSKEIPAQLKGRYEVAEPKVKAGVTIKWA